MSKRPHQSEGSFQWNESEKKHRCSWKYSLKTGWNIWRIFVASFAYTSSTWKGNSSDHGNLCESNKHICNWQVDKEKRSSLQFVSMHPKYKYSDKIAKKDEKSLENCTAQYSNLCFRHLKHDTTNPVKVEPFDGEVRRLSSVNAVRSSWDSSQCII